MTSKHASVIHHFGSSTDVFATAPRTMLWRYGLRVRVHRSETRAALGTAPVKKTPGRGSLG